PRSPPACSILSLHDALPISFAGAQPLTIDLETLVVSVPSLVVKERIEGRYLGLVRDALSDAGATSGELRIVVDTTQAPPEVDDQDRKSTPLNSSHVKISYTG